MFLTLILIASTGGCANDGGDLKADSTTASDDTAAPAGSDTATDGDGTSQDTDTSGQETNSTVDEGDWPEEIEAPEPVLSGELTTCEHSAPNFTLQYAGASPHIASVPIAVVDSVDMAADGFCLEQTFADGGVLFRCGRTDIDAPSAYLQGAPAPGQEVSIRLGVILDDELCWADALPPLALGEVSGPGFGYAPLREALSTPDYPPSAMGVMNTGEGSSLYAMSLMDSPDYGIRAGDVLWSYGVADKSGHIIETDRLTNGLLSFSIEGDVGSATHEIYDPAFADVQMMAIDAAGFTWVNQGACESGPHPECFGFIHHGNAALTGTNINLSMGYEQLLDDAGEPKYYPDLGGYYLLGATFQGHTLDHQGTPDRVFELSFHDLFDMDPDLSTKHATRFYEGPSGDTYRSAYYVNSADVTQDAANPGLYHLTGTVTVSPYSGLYHVTLNALGDVVEATLYNDLNDELDWGNFRNTNPLSTMGHSVEYMGQDSMEREHFLAYDRSVSRIPTELSKCAGFYHIVDDGGEMDVGGPYHNTAVTDEDGPICGNSMSYGNASILHALTIDGYPTPMDLVVSFDNVALPADQGGAWSDIISTYAEGTPRLMGLYLNSDRFDPQEWQEASTFLGRNVDGNDPVGFNSLIEGWPSILVADSPFILHDL